MLLTLLCVAPVLALRDFTPANELRYLSIADEALADGHGFSFSNHGVPYADKPPLYFWILMGCRVLLGGHHPFVLSLLSLLTAFGIVAVMDRWAFRALSPLTRAAAAAMLLTTVLFTGMAVYIRMDLLMCLFIVLALRFHDRGRGVWFGLFTFLALFTKGPVGLLLPPLSILVYGIVFGERDSLRKAFSLPFWLILGVLSLGWLAGAYLEGGRTYLQDLTLHQTFGRAVHAFHHQAPFWFYLPVIWGVAAPWCLLTLPAAALSLARGRKARYQGSEALRRERLFLSVVLTGLVLLSLFSSKLAIYLLPLLPFLTAVFVVVEQRRGWEGWMRLSLGIISLLFAGIGVAAIAGWAAFDRLPIPAAYGFARTPLLIPAGAVLIAGAVLSLAGAKRGWQRPVLVLAAAMMLCVPILSPLLPRVNEQIGYGRLCADIRSQEAGGEVYTLGLSRPENMDVYLHRPVRAVDPEAFAADPSCIPDSMTVVLSQKTDEAASGRYSLILSESGRSCTQSSGRYGIWR